MYIKCLKIIIGRLVNVNKSVNVDNYIAALYLLSSNMQFYKNIKSTETDTGLNIK